jgi:hypothetical protein
MDLDIYEDGLGVLVSAAAWQTKKVTETLETSEQGICLSPIKMLRVILAGQKWKITRIAEISMVFMEATLLALRMRDKQTMNILNFDQICTPGLTSASQKPIQAPSV